MEGTESDSDEGERPAQDYRGLDAEMNLLLV